MQTIANLAAKMTDQFQVMKRADSSQSQILKKAERSLSVTSKIPKAYLSSNPIDAGDFDKFLSLISANYRINAYDKTSVDYKAAQVIFEIAKDEGFEKEEFLQAIKQMIKYQKFSNWNASDFFKFERPMIYGKNEVMKLSDGTLNGFQRVECDGITIPIWIKETDDIKAPLRKFRPPAIITK